ncbi:MAG: Ig domain-containing protein [Bacteroidales bacterium]|nr:Ig domain-containing protein [Bacteroidales bacterium]
MKKIFAILGIAFAVACVSSCKQVEPPFIETTGVSVETTSLSIFPGDFVKIETNITPSDATSTYKLWNSSDTKVATVDNWGRVYGVAPGKCVITVTTDSGGYTATCNVTVNPINETGVSIEPAELTVYYDEYETLTATVEPSNASYKTVTWTSADETVATIDETGKIKGVGLGETTVTAKTHNGLTATCKVTVAVRMPTEPETLDIWKSDEASFRGLFGAAADEGKAAGAGNWLKYENGAATWTANETGKIRTATLTLSTGSSITVTQLAGRDFLGNWTVKSRLFNPNGSVTGQAKGTTGAASSPVTLAAVSGEVETLDGRENAFELSGLYLDAKMKVAFDIDYEAKTVKMGLFFDKRSTQLAKEGVYCAFVPELEGSRWGNYNFAPSSFGPEDCNYEWMWCISEDFNTFRYTPHTQYIVRGASSLMLIGISIQVSSSADPTTLPGGNNTAYDTIYQANFNSSDTDGLSISR